MRNAFLKFLEHLWRPTGVVLIVPLGIGIMSLVRARRTADLLILTVPTMLTMMAAWFHAYPYESRVILYLCPMLTLLVGDGLACIHDWLVEIVFRRSGQVQTSANYSALAGCVVIWILVLFPFAKTAYYVVVPRPRLTVEVWPEPDVVPTKEGVTY